MQNWLCIDAAAGRLEPEGEADLPKIIIVSDAVGGTKVDLDGRSLQEEQMGKHQRKWKRSNGVDWTENEKGREEIEVRIAEWFGLELREEVYEKIQSHA